MLYIWQVIFFYTSWPYVTELEEADQLNPQKCCPPTNSGSHFWLGSVIGAAVFHAGKHWTHCLHLGWVDVSLKSLVAWMTPVKLVPWPRSHFEPCSPAGVADAMLEWVYGAECNREVCCTQSSETLPFNTLVSMNHNLAAICSLRMGSNSTATLISRPDSKRTLLPPWCIHASQVKTLHLTTDKR